MESKKIVSERSRDGGTRLIPQLSGAMSWKLAERMRAADAYVILFETIDDEVTKKFWAVTR